MSTSESSTSNPSLDAGPPATSGKGQQASPQEAESHKGHGERSAKSGRRANRAASMEPVDEALKGALESLKISIERALATVEIFDDMAGLGGLDEFKRGSRDTRNARTLLVSARDQLIQGLDNNALDRWTAFAADGHERALWDTYSLLDVAGAALERCEDGQNVSNALRFARPGLRRALSGIECALTAETAQEVTIESGRLN